MWFHGLNDLVAKGESARKGIQSAVLGLTSTSGPSDNPSSSEGSKEAYGSFISTSSLLENIKDNFPKPATSGETLSFLKTGWGTVVEATKEATKHAVETIEKEQTRIQTTLFHKGPCKRDLSLPLDIEALKDAEVVYITDRLITMSHPAVQSSVNGDITPNRKLTAIAHLLQKRHDGRYMIWNLSELPYDYSFFDDQCMTFEFPGQPSPPLGMLMKILLSLESWLKADDRNVAVMHCLTGRGRTSTVMAAFLCWIGEAGFDSPTKALQYMAQCKKLDLETLTIPSQVRYVSYFTNMLDGVRPAQPPLLLKRIIMSEAPKLENYATQMDEFQDMTDGRKGIGCAPYIQIFKGGKLVFTAAASKSYNQSKEELPFCLTSDGSITFPIETVVHGDILIRCRHLTQKGQRVSMFRAAMHTGYIPPKVLRLRKCEIDGACSDARYPNNFYIDLVFEECSLDIATSAVFSTSDVRSDQSESASATNTPSAYDSMLHRDSRFWEVISKRRNEKKEAAKESDKTKENENLFYGPLIGRRREFEQEKKAIVSNHADLTVTSIPTGVQSFTIGEELDFTSGNNMIWLEESVKDQSKVEKEKDDLMEALMALEDDHEYADEEKITQINEKNYIEPEPIDEISNMGDIDSIELIAEIQDLQSQEVFDHQGFLGAEIDGSDLGDPELKDLEDFLMKVKI